MSVPQTSPAVIRRAGSQALTAAVLCALAWQIVAAPVHKRLAEASAAGAEQSAQLLAFDNSLNGMPILPEQIIATTQARAARLEELSRQTGDASSLYDALASVAKESGVRIERIEPRQTGQGARNAAKSIVESTSFGVEVVGDYPSLVRFVDRAERSIGLTRVTGMRIRPTIAATEGEPAGLLATTVETSHFRLPLTLAERMKMSQQQAADAKGTKGGKAR